MTAATTTSTDFVAEHRAFLAECSPLPSAEELVRPLVLALDALAALGERGQAFGFLAPSTAGSNEERSAAAHYVATLRQAAALASSAAASHVVGDQLTVRAAMRLVVEALTRVNEAAIDIDLNAVDQMRP